MSRLLTGSLLLLLAGAAAAAPPATPAATATAAAPAPAPAPAPASTRPVQVEPARDWPVFLATAQAEASLDAYEVLRKIYESGVGLRADCGAHMAELDRSLRIVPVGIALWRAGEVCARQQKDEAAASFYGEGVSRLAAHALAKDSTGPWNPPIRVVRMDDISSLVSATGLDVLYLYSDTSRAPEHMVITYALWDKDAKRERHLSFDFLDTLYQLKNSEKFAGYPAYRMAMRNAFEKTMTAADDDFGKDLAAADASRSLATSAEAVARLRETAAAGGPASLRLWIANCSMRPFDGCADGLVDALLPFAEEQWAMYQIQLALVYARGLGVKKDMDAAMTLVDSADRRWGGGNAAAHFAEQLMILDDGPLPAPVMERLQRAAAAGSGRAGMARMHSLLRREKTDKLGAESLAVVLALAEQGFAGARIAAYKHYAEGRDWPDAMEWLQRDAQAGDADGMERLASAMLVGEHVKRDVPGGWEMMRKAAQAGDSVAMSWLADAAFQKKRWTEAEAWYASGLAYEDEDALEGLLTLYGEQREGLDKGPAVAAAMYTAMEATSTPRFRRMHADFLLHKAPNRDPAKARRLLQLDADKGDTRSQVQLGKSMLLGDFGKPEPEAALALLEKAMAADEKGEVADSLAYLLFYKQRTPAARQRALEIQRALVKRKYLPGLNNLSWWLCTSPDASVRAPAEGMAVAEKMGDPDDLPWSLLDTVAACHAAVGQFDRAVALETKAIEQSTLSPIGLEDGELERRLQGYRDHHPYLEPADAKGD